MFLAVRTAQRCVLIAGLALVGCASDDDAITPKPTDDTTASKPTDGTTATKPTDDTTATKPTDDTQHVDSADPSGVYEDDFGISQHVSASAWTVGDDSFNYVEFHADKDNVVAQNAATNAYFPGLYSRFDWTTDASGQSRYCQTAYNAESAAAASLVARADESNLEKGCAGFPWSALKGPAIAGSYFDSYQGSHVISGVTWVMGGQGSSTFNLLVLSNTKRYLIAQNDAANTYNPSQFSRFDWTTDETGALYYCQTAYAAESAAAALAVTAAASSDLAKGCAGFPWTKLVSGV